MRLEGFLHHERKAKGLGTCFLTALGTDETRGGSCFERFHRLRFDSKSEQFQSFQPWKGTRAARGIDDSSCWTGGNKNVPIVTNKHQHIPAA